MKKTDKTQKRKQPSARVPAPAKDVTELTDQDLQQVQGGQSLNSVSSVNHKIP
jgi:bacteriocin-like protein